MLPFKENGNNIDKYHKRSVVLFNLRQKINSIEKVVDLLSVEEL